jgi:hypothetical protein
VDCGRGGWGFAVRLSSNFIEEKKWCQKRSDFPGTSTPKVFDEIYHKKFYADAVTQFIDGRAIGE